MKNKMFIHMTIVVTLAVMLFLPVKGLRYSSQNVLLQYTAGAPGSTPPEFKLDDLNGKKVSLSDFKGKKIFINFWATWCSWCVKEMPDIDSIYKEKIPGLVVLTIAVNDTRESVKSFLSNKDYSIPVLIDTEGAVADNYGVEGIPCSVFINEDFKIVRREEGQLSKAEMKKYIEELGGGNVTPTQKPTATPKPAPKPTATPGPVIKPTATPKPQLKPTPAPRQIVVKVNGNPVKLAYAPLIMEKNLMVPAEPVVRALGAVYKWDAKTGSISIIKGKLTIILKIGSKKAKVNGKEESISYPAQNYTVPFIPLKYVAERLGFGYSYDEKASTVSLKGK